MTALMITGLITVIVTAWYISPSRQVKRAMKAAQDYHDYSDREGI